MLLGRCIGLNHGHRIGTDGYQARIGLQHHINRTHGTAVVTGRGQQDVLLRGLGSIVADIFLVRVPAHNHVHIGAELVHNGGDVACKTGAGFVIDRCGCSLATLVNEHHHRVYAIGLQLRRVLVDHGGFFLEFQTRHAGCRDGCRSTLESQTNEAHADRSEAFDIGGWQQGFAGSRDVHIGCQVFKLGARVNSIHQTGVGSHHTLAIGGREATTILHAQQFGATTVKFMVAY